MDISNYLVDEYDTILNAMKKIDKNQKGIAFVCVDGLLKAVITDGDIRRSLIANKNIMLLVKEVANYSPKSMYITEAHRSLELMKEKDLSAIPIIDKKGKLCDIRFRHESNTVHLCKGNLNVPVVIMAGGKGTRLRPYTDILPKPLIPIGGKTITEHIISRFLQYGCKKFDIIVNYQKKLIEAYFSEKNELECKISFTEEENFMGTGGGLSLEKDKIKETFFLTNCDVLIDADYSSILECHKKNNCIITLVCAKKEIVVPYGTVELNKDGLICSFREKPHIGFNTSTGFYVVEPSIFDLIPRNHFIHITDIIEQCLEKGYNVGTYLIEDIDWMDMGQLEELSRMRERLE